MLNRVIFCWPLVVPAVLVPLLNELEAPPGLAITVYAIAGVICALIQGTYFDNSEKWLETDEERSMRRSQPEQRRDRRQN